MSFWRKALWFVAVLAGLYVMVLALVFALQRHLLYFPSHDDRRHAGNKEFLPFVDHEGTPLGYVRESESPKRAVIFFHGNAGEALHRAWITELVPDPSVALVLAEYPGYGATPGKPSQKAIVQAATKTYDEVAARWDVPITLLGESLGTGVAVWVASQRPTERLALIAPYNRLVEVAAEHYPMLLVRWVMSDTYPSADWLAQVDSPLFVIHGREDRIIPLSQAKSLFDGAPSSDKQMTILEGAAHNDLVQPLVSSEAAAEFRKFVRGQQQP